MGLFSLCRQEWHHETPTTQEFFAGVQSAVRFQPKASAAYTISDRVPLTSISTMVAASAVRMRAAWSTSLTAPIREALPPDLLSVYSTRTTK